MAIDYVVTLLCPTADADFMVEKVAALKRKMEKGKLANTKHGFHLAKAKYERRFMREMIRITPEWR